MAKSEGQWFIPSTLLSRVHAEQRHDGEFWALWADIDEPDGVTFEEMKERSRDCIPGAFMAYTSKSATEERQKARILIPLASPVSGAEWPVYQKILNDKLQSVGITPDRATERTGQPCYLPNRGDFYQHHTHKTGLLEPSTCWGDELAEEMERQAEEEAQAKAAKLKPRPASLAGAEGGIIDKVNAAFEMEGELQARGYIKMGRRYLSPQSSTKTPGVIVLESEGRQIAYSHHGETDPLSQLNHSGHALDMFDVICCLDYAGDVQQAIPALASLVDPDGQKQRQREYMAAKDTPRADISAVIDEPEQVDSPKAPSPAGVDLLTPPGIAGEICRYMKLTARRPRPELYPFAALQLMALVGRKRRSIYTNKLNLMTLAIAPTAAGKEKAQDGVKRMAHEQYCSNLIHGNAGSFRDLIYNLLDGDGASLYIVDEVHSFFDSIKSGKAQNYESKMEAEILTMNTTELYTFRGMEKRALTEIYQKHVKQLEKAVEDAGEDEEKAVQMERALDKAQRRLDWLENGLPDPFFSMMGHSVPERLDAFIKLDNISSGFLGRTLITRCPDTRAKLRRTPVDEHELAECELNITTGLAEIRRSGCTVAATDEAADYLDECIDWYEDDDQLNHHIAGGIYARAPEHLYRVATILALETGTITLEHARYAHALVRRSIEDVSYILLKAYSDSDGAQEKQVMQHARQTIHRNCKTTGLPLSRLKHLVTKPKGWEEMQARDMTRDRFSELIDRMMTAGELEKQVEGKRERYISRAAV
ncbi:hypothetical protein ACFQGA_11495 [Marinobacter koreensis]|uniref:hypothetical protein n=1 Tax=Marinobacter koreensis TaxID=335974 RepID=UPI00360EDDBB